MKKTKKTNKTTFRWLACPLLVGMASAALAQSAAAPSTVTLFGVVDVGLVHESGSAAGSLDKLTSGIGSGSRWGLRGSEDLGTGLSAIFLLESGFQADTGVLGQGGALFGRQAYVGLKGGWGMVNLGRQYTPQYLAILLLDPFGSGFAGNAMNIFQSTGNASSRMDNAVKYVSPVFAGFGAEVAVAPGEVSGSSNAGQQGGASLTYAGGPIVVRLGYHHRNNDTATVDRASANNTVVGTVVDLKWAKLHAAYGINRGLNSAPLRNATNPLGYATAPVASTRSRDLLLGATLPLGTGRLLASFVRKDDQTASNQDASQWGIGYIHPLSRRTDLYASYAAIDNDNNASFTVGSAIEGGSGDKAVQLGIRHSF